MSGPHRSGTRFVSRCFAWHSKTEWITEETAGLSERKFHDLLGRSMVTIQCPHFSHLLADVADDDTLIVFVRRDKEAIYVSRDRARDRDGHRIDFGVTEAQMLARYGYQIIEDPVQMVFDHWATQRKTIPHSVEVQYEAFEGHPLWESNRANFHVTQVVEHESLQL